MAKEWVSHSGSPETCKALWRSSLAHAGSSPAETRGRLPPASVKHEVAATHTTVYKRRFHCCTEFASSHAPSAIVSLSGGAASARTLAPCDEYGRSALFRLSHPLQAAESQKTTFSTKPRPFANAAGVNASAVTHIFLYAVRPSLLIWNRLSIHAQ